MAEKLKFRFLSVIRSGLLQQTRDIELMLGQCWADVVDSRPTLIQHCFNVSCLLGAYGRYPIKFILPEFVSYLGERGVLCLGNG